MARSGGSFEPSGLKVKPLLPLGTLGLSVPWHSIFAKCTTQAQQLLNSQV